ncbi:MAG: copper resistance protein B [Gammaproteobacteria bacterium]
MIRFLHILAGMLFATSLFAMGEDDPLLVSINVHELEWREDEDLAWDVQGWIGKDRDKLWFKSEGERPDSTTEEFETQVLWHRAVSPYWNLQTGWRGDWQPESRRSWFALGVAGTAPGFIETELTAFIADGRSGARLKAEYEIFVTRRWLLVPKLETNWYSDTDEVNGRGDGLTDLELDLRLKYQINPQLMPYVGVSFTRLFGETGDFAEDEGERDRSLQVLAGLSFWF